MRTDEGETRRRTRGGGERETGDTPAPAGDSAMTGAGTGTGVAHRTTGTGRGTGTDTGIGRETERGRETGRGETDGAEVAAETAMAGEKDTLVVSVKNGAEAGRNQGKGPNQDLKRRTIRWPILHHQIMIQLEWRQIRRKM